MNMITFSRFSNNVLKSPSNAFLYDQNGVINLCAYAKSLHNNVTHSTEAKYNPIAHAIIKSILDVSLNHFSKVLNYILHIFIT